MEIDEALEVMVVAVPSTPMLTRVNLEKNVEMPATKSKSVKDTPQCVMCEFIMTKLEAELKDKTTEVCNLLVNLRNKYLFIMKF